MSKKRTETSSSTPTMDWVVLTGLFLLFVVHRCLLHSEGLAFHFDLSWMQLLDPAWLRSDALRSLWVLHSQPPLFNALAALALKQPVVRALLPVFFCLLSFAALGLQYLSLRLLGLARPWAAVWIGLWVLSPLPALYENLFFYPVLEYAGVAAACYGSLRWSKQGGRLSLALWGASILLLGLLRPIYHPLFFIALVAAAQACARARRLRLSFKGLWLATALGLLLPSVWIAKNVWLFGGSPVGSSWSGLNLAHVILASKDKAAIRQLQGEGKLSPLALSDDIFCGVEACLEQLGRQAELAPREGPPALLAPLKGDGGANFNHWCYGQVSRLRAKDDRVFILARPQAYLGTVWRGVCLSFRPAVTWYFVDDPRSAPFVQGWLQQMDDVLELAAPGRMGTEGLGLYGSLVALALVFWAIRLSSWRPSHAPDHNLAMLFCGALVLLGVLGSACFEISENMRFRYSVEPAIMQLLAGFALSVDRSMGAKRPSSL